MPIKIFSDKGRDCLIENDIKILMNSVEKLVHPNVTLDEFLSNSSAELDRYILKQSVCGQEYVAGRFEVSCISDKVFVFTFSMYFKNIHGEWNEVKGESRQLPLLCFNDDGYRELREKGGITFEIELPVTNIRNERNEDIDNVDDYEINRRILTDDNNDNNVGDDERRDEDKKESGYEGLNDKISCIVETQINNQNLEEELLSCREYAMRGYDAVKESYEKLNSALIKEKNKLHEADQRQNEMDRLQNDKQFLKQLHEMEETGKEINNRVKTNIRDLHDRQDAFTIVLYGRTMAGKSTLMEILTHGNGASSVSRNSAISADLAASNANSSSALPPNEHVPGTS